MCDCFIAAWVGLLRLVLNVLIWVVMLSLDCHLYGLFLLVWLYRVFGDVFIIGMVLEVSLVERCDS